MKKIVLSKEILLILGISTYLGISYFVKKSEKETNLKEANALVSALQSMSQQACEVVLKDTPEKLVTAHAEINDNRGVDYVVVVMEQTTATSTSVHIYSDDNNDGYPERRATAISTDSPSRSDPSSELETGYAQRIRTLTLKEKCISHEGKKDTEFAQTQLLRKKAKAVLEAAIQNQ